MTGAAWKQSADTVRVSAGQSDPPLSYILLALLFTVVAILIFGFVVVTYFWTPGSLPWKTLVEDVIPTDFNTVLDNINESRNHQEDAQSDPNGTV